MRRLAFSFRRMPCLSGRFAAALSHEMNTPLGALGSSIDTLSSLVEKARSQPSGGLDEAAIEITGTARQSLGRLRETLERMRHISNLDRAEVQMVNLNELWVNLVALLGGELGDRAEVKLDLKPLPPMKCRPQQLSAVFLASPAERRGFDRDARDHQGLERPPGRRRRARSAGRWKGNSGRAPLAVVRPDVSNRGRPCESGLGALRLTQHHQRARRTARDLEHGRTRDDSRRSSYRCPSRERRE